MKEDPAAPPTAIISDIHSNLPALLAVLDDIASRGIDRIVCLGDIVGYGPNPVECWRLVSEKCRVVIRGNHDQALDMQPRGNFHPRAAKAIAWTHRRILIENGGHRMLRDLATLPVSATEGQFLYVHGSPTGPTMSYLLPGDSFDRHRMKEEFARMGTYAVCGHTHIPGVIVRGSHFMPPEALDKFSLALMGRQTIINVGSVGQPRDGNPKSSYATVENNVVHFHRVAYDAERVCRDILEIKELDPFLGQRLLAGY